MSNRNDVIVITDPGKDLDDENALVLLKYLVQSGYVRVLAVVANLAPAMMRARIAKGTLKQLGLGGIPVGAGFPVFSGMSHQYEANLPYLAKESEVEAGGQNVILRALQFASPKSVTLLLISGMTDAATFLYNNGGLFREKVEQVVIMGGVETLAGRVRLNPFGFMSPNNANNNSFDTPSAIFLHEQLQVLKIPMVVVTREAAYAAKIPFKTYNRFIASKHPVGLSIAKRQKDSCQALWTAACSPAGSKIRGTLPVDRNREWFIKTFCGETNVPDDLGPEDNIRPYVQSVNWYDPIAAMAINPRLRHTIFNPTIVNVNGVEHQIIGVSPENHGIWDIPTLTSFMINAEVATLNS